MNKRIPELDGLRAIAVAMVVLWHYVGIPAGSDSLAFTIFRLGRSGVDLFFVLSGFLITSILLERRGGAGYYGDFYLRRAVRILPLYAVMLTIFFLGRKHGWSETIFGGPFNDWAYVFFLQNFEAVRSNAYGPLFLSATWSLAVEEQFYLVFPFVVALVPRKRLPVVLLWIVAGAFVLRYVAFKTLGHYAAYTLMPCRADTLAIGALIAWAMHDAPTHERLLENKLAIRLACYGLLCGAALLWFIPTPKYMGHMGQWGYGFLALVYGAVVLAVLVHAGARPLWVLRSRAAAGLAAVSYALYLFHAPVLAGVFELAGRRIALNDAPALALVAIALAVSVALSVVSLVVLESPIRRLAEARPRAVSAIARP